MPGLSRRDFVTAVASGPLVSRLLAHSGRRRQGAGEHVVVVGAGAFGGWTALALRRAGWHVTLVDAWGAGHSRSSSGDESRVFRAVYGGVAAYTEMAARALVLWREAERQWQQRVFHRIGALWMCASDDSYVTKSLPHARAAGLMVEELSVANAARRFPQVSFRDVRTVYFEPEAGALSARLACELVRATLVGEGGTYRQASVRPVVRQSGRLAQVDFEDGSRLEADRFVFACGPWMPQLFPDVIGRRIVPTRQEVFYFGPPAGDTRFDSLPAWVHIGDRLVYGIPGNERRGFKVADDTSGPEIEPTTMDRVPSAAGLANARGILRDRFPGLADAPLVEARVCQYEASTDGHFLIDRHPTLENVWLVGGGSGHGFKMGPALGEHVAALVQGRAAPIPLFRYERLVPRAVPR